MPAIALSACGFMAGLVAGLFFSWAPWLLTPAACGGAVVLWRRWRAGGMVLAAASAGAVWGGAALYLRQGDCRLGWRHGAQLALVVEPRDLAPDEARSVRYTIRRAAHCAGPIRVVLPRSGAGHDSGPAASVLLLTGTWRRDPEFARAAWPLRPERAGLFVAQSARPTGEPLSLRSRLRIRAEERLAVLFGPRRWPLAAALTVSAEASLPAELRQAFRRSGLTHILSISGFHVAILAGALIVVLRACRLAPDAARIAGTALVILYVWMLGYPAPAARSAALVALWCWARVRQRPPLPAALLAATALAVATLDPWAVLEPGPWLSFGGVWGCACASWWWSRLEREQRSRLVRRTVRWLAPVAVSVGATLATSPVQALVFGTVTPIGVVANLAAIPLAAFAVPALALALVLASLPVPGAVALAAYPAGAAGLALDGLEHAAALAARAGWASFDVDPRVPVALLGAAAAWWLLRAGPARRRVGAVLGARACAALAAAAVFASWLPLLAQRASSDGDGRLALDFLSVGQGDATLIRTPRGKWILIDGGPRFGDMDAGQRTVVPFLRRHGVRRLAVVVASHGDADHLGGLPAVLGAVPVDLALEPGVPLGRPLYHEWLARLAEQGARWHPARAGQRLEVDGVTLRLWHPDSATIAAGWEPNENSVVLTVEYGGFRALFGGDAGLPMEALRAAAIGDVTLLKVGHHGSRSATGERWLEALRPEVCIIPVGAGNRYGHPDPGVVARLAGAGCRVWRTDRLGAIRVTTDGRAVTIRAAPGDTTFFVTKEPS